jgi:hypothetical protein
MVTWHSIYGSESMQEMREGLGVMNAWRYEESKFPSDAASALASTSLF